MNISQRLV